MQKINLKKLLLAAKNRKQRRTVIFFLVKLGFTNISVAEKVIKANKIVTMMTGNANFTTPSPTLASITALSVALSAAESAMDGSEIKTEARNNAEAALELALGKLQGYVQSVCGTNAEMILSSGFDVRNPRTNPAVLNAPEGITAESTQIEGQIKLKWKPVKGSKLYVIESANDSFPPIPITWEVTSQSTKATVTFNDLQPGQKYRFRVAAINAAGMSGFSEEAVCRPS